MGTDSKGAAARTLVEAPTGQGTKRLRTRATLLNTAARIFAEKGIRSTSVLEITKEAGVSNGTFYAHFKNKDELTESVAEILITLVHDQLHTLIDPIDQPALKIATGVQWLIRFADAKPEIGSLLTQTLTTDGAFLQETLSRMRQDVARGVEAGQFEVDDADLTVRLLNGITVSSIRMIRAGRELDKVQYTAAAAQLRVLVFRGEAGPVVDEARRIVDRDLPHLHGALTRG